MADEAGKDINAKDQFNDLIEEELPKESPKSRAAIINAARVLISPRDVDAWNKSNGKRSNDDPTGDAISSSQSSDRPQKRSRQETASNVTQPPPPLHVSRVWGREVCFDGFKSDPNLYGLRRLWFLNQSQELSKSDIDPSMELPVPLILPDLDEGEESPAVKAKNPPPVSPAVGGTKGKASVSETLEEKKARIEAELGYANGSRATELTSEQLLAENSRRWVDVKKNAKAEFEKRSKKYDRRLNIVMDAIWAHDQLLQAKQREEDAVKSHIVSIITDREPQ